MGVIEIRMPKEDREGTEASVGKWLKREGEAVQEHEPVLEINTDKVTVEIAAPASGVLAEHVKQEGEDVAPGELLGRISTEVAARGQGGVATADRALSYTPVRVGVDTGASEELSPAVRRMLKEHQLEAASIPKVSGGGRLSIKDVELYLANAGGGSLKSPAPVMRRTGRVVPHTPMRKSIAAHMTRSVQAAPHVTSVFEADLSAVLRDREEWRQRDEDGAAPSITAYLMRAAIEAIRQVPEVNSRWHEDALEIFEWVNFGVGTALDNGGLVVPVIRDAQQMELRALSESLRALTEKARKGRLTQQDMEGGTFTLSNHGVSGSLLAAPIIIPYGQTAILGAGKLQKRVIVCETGGRELFRVRPMMYVTLTVDHRALDAQQTNAFLTKFVAALESPAAG